MYLQLCSLVFVFISERFCTDIGAYTEPFYFSTIASYTMASTGEIMKHLPRTVLAISQDFLYSIFDCTNIIHSKKQIVKKYFRYISIYSILCDINQVISCLFNAKLTFTYDFVIIFDENLYLIYIFFILYFIIYIP